MEDPLEGLKQRLDKIQQQLARSGSARYSPRRTQAPLRSKLITLAQRSPQAKRSSPKRSSPKPSSPKRSSPKRSSPKRSSPKRSSRRMHPPSPRPALRSGRPLTAKEKREAKQLVNRFKQALQKSRANLEAIQRKK
jgi:hypothetical protein